MPPAPVRPRMSDGGIPDRADRAAETRTWPDLVIDLYDSLTGRGAEITYEFDDLEVDVPSTTGEDPDHAHWRVDGTLKVSTRERD